MTVKFCLTFSSHCVDVCCLSYTLAVNINVKQITNVTVNCVYTLLTHF